MIADLHDSDFPDIYLGLKALMPREPWLKRVSNLQHQAVGSPLTARMLIRDNSFSYGMAAWTKYGSEFPDHETWAQVAKAMATSAQIIALAQQSHGVGGSTRPLVNRLDGAIRNPADMRALEFELQTAVNLLRRGCHVQWVDDCNSPTTFDLLVTTPGHGTIEVECKSFSLDKGLPIKEAVATTLMDRLWVKLSEMLRQDISDKLISITLEFMGGIPTNVEGQKRLIEQLLEAWLDQRSEIPGVCLIASDQFDLSPGLSVEKAADEAVRALSDLQQIRPALYTSGFPFGDGAWLCLRLASSRAEKWEKLYKGAVEHGIRNQLSRSRPGCVVIRLEGKGSGELVSTANKESSDGQLYKFARKMLEHRDHQHLANITFVSGAELKRISPGEYVGQSVSYYFENIWGLYPEFGLGSLFK